MAISFKDSLKQSVAPGSKTCVQNMTPPIVYAASDDDWVRDNRYLYYDDYADTDLSVIDRLKNIELSQTQTCLTQESNSQMIPFEMDRFYDNFDLCNTLLSIHFVNAENAEAEDSPINVHYNSKKIRFGWLVDSRATYVAGNIQFEIIALGTNEEGEEYIWKTKPCSGLSILRSLSGNGMIEPDDSWQSGFISQMLDLVHRAEAAAKRAEEAGSGANITLDKTLTIEGQAADAKAVGDALSRISFDLDATLTIAGVAADAKAVGDRLVELFGDISEALNAINGTVV